MTAFAFQNILDKLRINNVVTYSGKKEYKLKCISPSHQEDTASLYVKDSPDRVLLYCFGCGGKAKDILSGIGLPGNAIYDKYWVKNENITIQSENLYEITQYFFDNLHLDISIPKKTKKKLQFKDIEKLKIVIEKYKTKYKENLILTEKLYDHFDLLNNLLS